MANPAVTAHIAVKRQGLLVDIEEVSPSSEATLELALATAAGSTAEIVGPFALDTWQPAKCYGRVVLESAPRDQLLAAVEIAAGVLRDAGYTVVLEAGLGGLDEFQTPIRPRLPVYRSGRAA